ncbi:uncharacterized protein LOC117216655 [Bombus bifarius]|uniref:Uncharacterized protein LOC117216655 n=1 Tax=Bombus bifarius TaxID=103933 RepID=A0A6P8NH21_9HYME|nr:uncharacterized protein LOC117216655 [Bombus bifarius]
MFHQHWKKTIIWIIITLEYIRSDLEVKPFNYANIFLEHIDNCYLYNEQIDITLIVGLNDPIDQVNRLQRVIDLIDRQCKPPCAYTPEISSLKFKYRNLQNLTRQLKLLLRYKSKRGLLNVIGSVSKILFGTLDENDLELINKNIDTLFDSNNKIKTVLSNQTALIKRVLDNTKTNQLENLANDIHKIENHNEKNEILVSLLIQTESTISELHINIDEIFNTVMLGKQGIINPQVIEPEQFLKTLDQITRQNFMTNHIEPSVQNFQLILDLSKLKVWIRDNKLIYTITVPLLESNEWKITKIYPIPSKQNFVFIAPVIETDLILTDSKQYTFVDSHYLNKYCKRTATIHICKRTQPSHNRINSPECRSELINNRQTVKTCPTAVFKLEELTFVPLQTENHYIIIPAKNVQIDVLCKTHKILEIRRPSLISKKILETAPKVTHNFNQYKANLDTLQTQISTLQFERRINSLKEYGISTLQILGIVALGLGTIYVMYKCKLFECLRRSLPKNVRIKILCPTARVNRIDQTSTVPRTVTFQNITEDEDEGIIQLRSPTRALRFSGAKRS